MTSNTHSDDNPRENSRDFADFLVGSDRMDPETQLPLPGQANGDTNADGNDTSGSADPATTATEPATASATAPATTPVTTAATAPAEPTEGKKQRKKKDEEILRPEQRDRSEVIGTGMRWFTGWCLRFLIVAVAGYAFAILFAKLWSGILPVLLSIIACSMLWPVVRTLRKFKIPNALAVLTTLLGFFAVLVGIFALILPSTIDQSRELINQANSGVRKIQAWLQGPPLNLQESQFNEGLEKATAWLQARSGELAGYLATAGTATASATVTLVIVLVLTFFFLKDGEKLLPTLRRITGRRVGWHLTELLTRMWNTLGGFIRTQALVSFVDAFFIGIGLMILNVPLAGPLAVLTFFAGFIPMIGAFVAGALSVLVALVAIDFTTALIVLALVIAVQQLEGNVLQPVLQSRAMNIHPVIILLSVTLGGTLFGVIGAFLAVPTAAMLAVAFRYLGDLTDLATGEKLSDDIEFTTTAGALTGEQSERQAKHWQEMKERARQTASHVVNFGNNESAHKSSDESSEGSESRLSNFFRGFGRGK